MAAPDLAPFIEHTLLSADATQDRHDALCREAREHRFFGVCVAPAFVARARAALSDSPVRVVTVAGFPLGSSTPSTKAAEAARAIEDGADEVDMVLAIGLAKSGGMREVADDVRAVRDATAGRVLKVILETGYFSEAELPPIVEAVLSSGADFLKTCTGFGPRGATVDDVRTLCRLAAGRARVKASGGVRTREAALAMVEAGASRIGTSGGVAMVL